jgi:hypothetical protein
MLKLIKVERIRIINKLLLTICVIGSIFSCENTTNKEQAIAKIQNTEPDSLDYNVVEKALKDEQRAQFYVVQGRTVVFFMISKKEFNELLLEMGDSYRWDTEALFNNFSWQANTFLQAIKKQNINCIISTSEKFEIRLKNGKTVSFDRIEKDQVIGQILTDGVQEPLIEYGMYNSKELSALIENFFKLKSIGYIPVDTLNTTKQQEDVEEEEASP